jgi:hypothetical protein
MTQRDLWVASLSPTEHALWSQLIHSIGTKALQAGRPLSIEQLEKVAAAKIEAFKVGGVRALKALKLERVPEAWPEVKRLAEVRKERKEAKKVRTEPTEAEIQKDIVDHLIRNGWLVLRINSGGVKQGDRYIQMNRCENNGKGAGLPDIIAAKGDRILMLEVKAKDGRLQDSQKEFAQEAAKYGVRVSVVRNIEEVDRLSSIARP